MKAGWEVKTLGEVCEVVAGQSPESSAYNSEANGLPFYQGKKEFAERYLGEPTTWTTETTKTAFAGDILMSVRAPVGPINEATETICIGRGLAAIRPISQIYKDFLWFALLWMQPKIAGTEGAVFASINKQGIAALPFPLPPLDEQKRIVEVLDAAFEGLSRARAHTETNLQNARELFEGYVEDALAKSGGEPRTLQELLDDGSIISHLDGNHGGLYPKKSEFVSTGVPYISANCIDENLIQMDRCKFLTPERAATLRKGVAQNGDVIFAHNATVGPVALLETDEESVILSTSLTYYRCDPNRINPIFLMNAMRGAGFRRQYEAVMGQSTRNQVPITMQRTFFHTVPALEVQTRIAAACVEIEQSSRELVSHYRAKLADLDDLRQSLLQKAFAGELT